MARPIVSIPLSDSQRQQLQPLVNQPTSSQRLARRCRIILQERDLNPVRYTWKAEGEKILRKIQRARQALPTT